MAKKGQIAKTAPEALKILWQEAFFRTWRNQAAIVGHLAKRGNHFSGPELGMALKRAKHLTRNGNRGSYEYIQKYPFATDDKSPTSKNKKKV
ncbi:MAG: hypothetical protein WBG02_04295 [Candidatus Acidiferrum sp.]